MQLPSVNVVFVPGATAKLAGFPDVGTLNTTIPEPPPAPPILDVPGCTLLFGPGTAFAPPPPPPVLVVPQTPILEGPGEVPAPPAPPPPDPPAAPDAPLGKAVDPPPPPAKYLPGLGPGVP